MKHPTQTALVAALAVMGTAQAAIVVDDFNDPSGGLTASIIQPPGPTTFNLGPTTGPDIVGGLGTRNIIYSVTPTPAGSPTVDSINVNTAPYSSYLVVASDHNGAPSTMLDYSGFNVSLTANTLTLHSYATDANAESVEAWFVTSGGTMDSGIVPVAGNHSGDLTLTLSGVGDLTQVTGIQVQFLGAPGADFELHGISVVPEPGAYGILAALGLLGTVIWRRARA